MTGRKHLLPCPINVVKIHAARAYATTDQSPGVLRAWGGVIRPANSLPESRAFVLQASRGLSSLFYYSWPAYPFLARLVCRSSLSRHGQSQKRRPVHKHRQQEGSLAVRDPYTMPFHCRIFRLRDSITCSADSWKPACPSRTLLACSLTILTYYSLPLHLFSLSL